MASSLLPPNPCLVAILLIVNYHHQPRIVFHYPPRPGEDNAQFKNYLSSDCSDGEATTSSDDESGGSSDSNAGTKGNRDDKNKDEEREMEIDVDEAGSVSPEKFDGVTSMRRSLQWDDVFGYQAMNLAKLLCPALSNHKKRFEMSLNEKAFLGWPVFSKDGRWQRKKKGEKWKSGNHSLGGSKDKGERRMIDGKTSLQISEELGETSGQDTDLEGLMKQDEVEEGITPGFTTSVKDVAPKGEKVAEEQAKPKRIKDEVSMDTLKMFHVVFVLDPPPLEYHFRMKEMYDHVVKKFSRALKWEQARSNYVTREVANISSTCKTSRKSGGGLLPWILREFADSLTDRSFAGLDVPSNYVSIESCKRNFHAFQSHI